MRYTKGNKYEHGIIWDLKPLYCGWVYLYNKGKFRGWENSVVISTSLTGGSNPDDRKNTPFNTKKQAMQYAKQFMEALQ